MIVAPCQRRIEMRADRIEACCAGKKVNAQARVCRQRRGRLIFLVSTSPTCDLRKLQDEIALSLGVPVTVYRDAVICETLP